MTEQQRPKREAKSLFHRLDLSGVKVPTPENQSDAPRRDSGNGNGGRRPPRQRQEPVQKRASVGDKNSEPEASASTTPCTEKDREVMSEQSQTELQAAAMAESALKGALGSFKGIDIKVKIHEKGVDWAGVAETGMKVGIGIVGVAGATAVGFGVARAFGYKPGGGSAPPTAAP